MDASKRRESIELSLPKSAGPEKDEKLKNIVQEVKTKFNKPKVDI